VGERTISEGDMVVLDFGGIQDGYGSLVLPSRAETYGMVVTEALARGSGA
jgi:hypothetical protein